MKQVPAMAEIRKKVVALAAVGLRVLKRARDTEGASGIQKVAIAAGLFFA